MADTKTGRGGREVEETDGIEQHDVPRTLHALSPFIFTIIHEAEVLLAPFYIHAFNKYLLSAC